MSLSIWYICLRVVNCFIYLQQVGNVFYSEETWRDLPLKKVKFFVVFSYFRLEEKRKFKNQSASQWVQLRGKKLGFQSSTFSQPKIVWVLYNRGFAPEPPPRCGFWWKNKERGTEKTRVVIIILRTRFTIGFIHLSVVTYEELLLWWYLTYPSLE